MNEKGFTLLELLCVMVIAGVVFSIGLKKYHIAVDSAVVAARVDSVIKLNTMENVAWLIALMNHEYKSDSSILESDVYSLDLGPRYSWRSISKTGGILLFDGSPIQLNRTPSTPSLSGRWSFT